MLPKKDRHEDESDMIGTVDQEFSPLKPLPEPLVPLGPNSIVVASESEKGIAMNKNGPSDGVS